MTEKEDTLIAVKPNDFVIRISPHVDDDDSWTGDIDISTVTTDDNVLDYHDFQHLSLLTDMLISAIPLMETDMEVRKKLFKMAQLTFDTDEEIPKSRVKERSENVIKVNF